MMRVPSPQEIEEFRDFLTRLKRHDRSVDWYPYGTMANIDALGDLFRGECERLAAIDAPAVLDVGAGDGDLAFLMAQLGCRVDVVENPSTNFNHCRGFRRLQQLIPDKVTLIEQDVDFNFSLASEYDLAFALGILYHLRNPFMLLTKLALHCERMLLSTRIAQVVRSRDIHDMELAYLLDTRESGNDPTNYWIFSEPALRRLLKRCGWTVIGVRKLGCAQDSNPFDPDKDERIFVHCRRVPGYAGLLRHHDF